MQSKGRRQARRLGMTVAGVATVLLVSIAVAGPAWGKGAEAVTITGPGLDRPIEIQLSGPGSLQDDTPPYLKLALTELTKPHTVPEVELTAGPLSGRLNDRYTLTWRMWGPADADPADYTVVQDVYPDAQFGPVIHTHPGPVLAEWGGWDHADAALRDTLAALGVPVSGLPRGLVDPSTVAAQTPEPATAKLWWLPVAATAGLAAGIGLGVTLTKRRTRERPLPSVQAATIT
jgi:hypothetical protein